MKLPLFILLISTLLGSFDCKSQTIEEQVINSYFVTESTSHTYSGQWTKIATCTNTAPYQDFGTIFELFANGGSGGVFYYGVFIARIKRQNIAPGNPTSYSFLLYNSNIGAENIKGVVNGATIDIYLRINTPWTTYYYRRILRGSSLISGVSHQPFLKNLPSGDFIIHCKEGDLRANNLEINGKVGIGTTTPDSKLTVAGKIHAQEIKVTTTAGADFVFEADYPLRSLEETEQFIKENKHLPDIPSAEEMVEEGITLGEMNVKLLQKIEELTLYMIEMKKETERQNKIIENQQEQINTLKDGLAP